MNLEGIKTRIEEAREAAERAHLHSQVALAGLSAGLLAASTGQLAAEHGQRVAEAAQLAAEAARDAAEAARDAAEAAQAVAEDAAHEAEVAQRDLQNFLAMAAHDIRGPLAVIAGFADLLERPNTPPTERAVAVGAIQDAALRMDRLVADLVDAGRLGVGSFHLRPEQLDLVSLVQRVADGQQLTSDRHRILIDAPERLDGSWDADRLVQVVTNLLSNALKYSPAGDVRVSVSQERESAVVRVADQGMGIRADDLQLLFRPFIRLITPEEQLRVPGTGLGLYISYGIVQAHGGSITVTSEGPGTGSVFIVRLPLSTHGT